MKVGVLGAGMMGSSIASYLAFSGDVDHVTIADISEERLENLKKMSKKKIRLERLDVAREDQTVEFIKGHDVVASALPHGFVHIANLACIRAGGKMVDIAFEDQQMELQDRALKTNSLIIPGCGLAPGLSGILLYTGALLTEGKKGTILVGGLPKKREPPFYYRLLFSVVGLLREYLSYARVIREGRIVRLRPFDKIIKVRFPKPIGVCEAFYTDGLGTLIYSLGGMDEVSELTLRWPGHAERFKFLIDAGFFDRRKIMTPSGEISPYEFMKHFLEIKLSQGEPEDITILRVKVGGKKGLFTATLIDSYDKKRKMTSMARTTGFTCASVVRMIGNGQINLKGIVPPEKAVSGKNFETLIDDLKTENINIKIRLKKL